ncbi:MAG: hypothetical protein RLZZ519_844, partial [Bacteroidota bacterium]
MDWFVFVFTNLQFGKMKPIPTLLASLLSFSMWLSGFAQPSITASVHRPHPGDTLVRSIMTVPNFSPGPAGVAQTFLFNSAFTTGSVELGLFTADSTIAPWTYNLRANFDDGGLGYVEYFRSTNDSLAFSGFDKYIPDVTPFERHNPSIKFPYPFTYG